MHFQEKMILFDFTSFFLGFFKFYGPLCCCGNPHNWCVICVCASWPQICGRAFGRVKWKVSLCARAWRFQLLLLLNCDEYVWPADDTFVCEEVHPHNASSARVNPHSAADRRCSRKNVEKVDMIISIWSSENAGNYYRDSAVCVDR